ncbi:MAG: hypothetical protein QHH02_00845 [Syntrophomonadaceae bacterium]|nr:hypothetical protein [Syntrophomonadaceae bacterium]
MTSASGNKHFDSIGGEFSLGADDFLKPETNVGVLRPDKKNHLFLDTGRSAIYVALLSIIQQGGKKEAWLPRYCCQSVLQPFQALGYKINYYSLGIDLKTPSDLPSKLDGETFFFIHYFGKRNRNILNYLARMKKEFRFFVIEDCVQALLNRNLGTHDFVVNSYRKFLPQPDGALLASDLPLAGHCLQPADETFVSSRLIGKLIRPWRNDELCLDLFSQAERIIDNFGGPREMSYLSRFLLTRTDILSIAEKRRDNFFYLLGALNSLAIDHDLIHPLFDSLEVEEVPLGLPVVVNPNYRDKLRIFLKSHKIYCPIHWPLKIEKSASWENELLLSCSLLTLPLDQRLDHSALDYLVEKIHGFVRLR